MELWNRRPENFGRSWSEALCPQIGCEANSHRTLELIWIISEKGLQSPAKRDVEQNRTIFTVKRTSPGMYFSKKKIVYTQSNFVEMATYSNKITPSFSSELQRINEVPKFSYIWNFHERKWADHVTLFCDCPIISIEPDSASIHFHFLGWRGQLFQPEAPLSSIFSPVYL
jgi:hypothetical protein